jgi:hypothetical protein
MHRRWLIRLPFLLALAFFAAVWVISHFGRFSLYKYSGGHIWELGAVEGLVFSGESGLYPLLDSPPRIQFVRGWKARQLFPDPPTLGFYCGRWPRFSDSFGIAFPLWLPTLLSALLLWLVWRKTRPKLAGNAFPIEPTAKPK